MPSDTVWVALIAAVPTTLAMLGGALRFWIQRRDAERKIAHEAAARETEQDAARQTVRALRWEVRDLKQENRELRTMLHRLLRYEADGRLGTRSPRDTA